MFCVCVQCNVQNAFTKRWGHHRLDSPCAAEDTNTIYTTCARVLNELITLFCVCVWLFRRKRKMLSTQTAYAINLCCDACFVRLFPLLLWPLISFAFRCPSSSIFCVCCCFMFIHVCSVSSRCSLFFLLYFHHKVPFAPQPFVINMKMSET